MKKTLFLLIGTMFLFSCGGQSGESNLLYKDASQPVEKRVKDLVGRMTLHEKIIQMNQASLTDVITDGHIDTAKMQEVFGDCGYGCIQGITLSGSVANVCFNEVQRYCMEKTRLGIPILNTTEALHGSVQDGSTIFPQSIAIGATFNTELARKMAAAISEELYSEGVNQILCPVVDVTRDMRWGRTEETFGEDPYLNGMMGIAEVSTYLEHDMSPVVKHFGPGAETMGGLNLASVSSGKRDVLQIHLKPFEMVIKNTGIKGIMTSYNSWDGIPNSGSHYLLTELLRDEWGFDGYVYSDWGSANFIHSFERAAADEGEAGVMAISAGMDFEVGSTFRQLEQLVEEGKFDEKIIDQAVGRILKVKFELGLFENPYRNEGGQLVVRTPEHLALARQMADESLVLLQNNDNLLPLSKDKIRSLAVIGPNADQVQFGDYTWSRSNADGITPLAGLRALLGDGVNIQYAKGCDLVTDDTSGFNEAVKLARNSDAAIVFLGTASASLAREYADVTSGEGFDQCDLNLTGAQQQLLEAVYQTGKPVVLVLVTGKPITIPWAKDHIPAIVAQWYGGEKAGDAIASMLFGETVPCGKTPISWPKSVGHLPAFYNHLPCDKGFYHQPGSPNHPGRDYVFSSPDPLWSFGHGLSYTSFEYGTPTLSALELSAQDTLTVSIPVSNTGTVDAKETVQLYFRDVVSSVITPVKQLKAFQKVLIPAGQTETITMKVPIQEFALYDKDMNLTVEPGEFEIQIGSASDDIRQTVTVKVGEKTRTVKGTEELEKGIMVTPDGDTIRRE